MAILEVRSVSNHTDEGACKFDLFKLALWVFFIGKHLYGDKDFVAFVARHCKLYVNYQVWWDRY